MESLLIDRPGLVPVAQLVQVRRHLSHRLECVDDNVVDVVSPPQHLCRPDNHVSASIVKGHQSERKPSQRGKAPCRQPRISFWNTGHTLH
jgi:hypothetical protein